VLVARAAVYMNRWSCTTGCYRVFQIRAAQGLSAPRLTRLKGPRYIERKPL
jgi:hypothetical protein